MDKIKLLVCFIVVSFFYTIDGYSQLKKFQRYYIGGNVGYAYVPLDSYNNNNARFIMNVDPNGTAGIKPFDNLNSFQPVSFDFYLRDSKEYGFRFFADYYSSEIQTKTTTGSSVFTRNLTSLDFGAQFLWFLTEDYIGNQAMLGFGGAVMLPVISETDKTPTKKLERIYENISGGAHFSFINLIPIYQKLVFQIEVAYRFSRSSTFFEVNTNTPLNADIELSGYIAKVGLLYQIQ